MTMMRGSVMRKIGCVCNVLKGGVGSSCSMWTRLISTARGGVLGGRGKGVGCLMDCWRQAKMGRGADQGDGSRDRVTPSDALVSAVETCGGQRCRSS